MATCDGRFAKLIDSILTDGATMPPAKWQKLRAHLADCADCRDRYNRVSLAERALHGGPPAFATISPATLARIGGGVIAGDGARGFAALPRWVFGLMAVGVAAAFLPFVLRTRPTVDNGEFGVRGAANDPAQQAGLRAFCLYNEVVRPLEDDARATTPQCSAAHLLKLTYSNRAGYEELFLVGVDEKYELKWYEPRPPSTLSVPVMRGVDQPIGGAIKVGVNHEPGLVRVFALFSHAPIAAREVEAAVEELKRTRAEIKDAPSLPMADRDDIVQRSLLFEVTGAH